MLKAGCIGCRWLNCSLVVSVSAGIQTRRHTKVCQLVSMLCRSHIPSSSLAFSTGLNIMDKVCVWKPLSKQVFLFTFTTTTKKTRYEYSRVHVLLIICMIHFWGDSQTSPLMNIAGNVFDHHALQYHSGYGYGEHQHININTPEDKPIRLGALLWVYLIFRFFKFCFATKIRINTDN
jgi:hypothetical protein